MLFDHQIIFFIKFSSTKQFSGPSFFEYDDQCGSAWHTPAIHAGKHERWRVPVELTAVLALWLPLSCTRPPFNEGWYRM